MAAAAPGLYEIGETGTVDAVAGVAADAGDLAHAVQVREIKNPTDPLYGERELVAAARLPPRISALYSGVLGDPATLATLSGIPPMDQLAWWRFLFRVGNRVESGFSESRALRPPISVDFDAFRLTWGRTRLCVQSRSTCGPTKWSKLSRILESRGNFCHWFDPGRRPRPAAVRRRRD